MAHDVFISYSSKDKLVAEAMCATLESRRIRCWIAPRDVLPGLPYGEALAEALQASRLLVLVFSASSNNSPQVMREVERSVSKGIPIIPFRIEEVSPSKSMEYFISTTHWLDALAPPMEKHLNSLAKTVQLFLSRLDAEDAADPVVAQQQENSRNTGSVGSRKPAPPVEQRQEADRNTNAAESRKPAPAAQPPTQAVRSPSNVARWLLPAAVSLIVVLLGVWAVAIILPRGDQISNIAAPQDPSATDPVSEKPRDVPPQPKPMDLASEKPGDPRPEKPTGVLPPKSLPRPSAEIGLENQKNKGTRESELENQKNSRLREASRAQDVSMTFGPGEQTIELANSFRNILVHEGQTIQMIDRRSSSLIWSQDAKCVVFEVCVSKDESRVYVAEEKGLLCLDAQTGKEMFFRALDSGAFRLAVSPNGQSVMVSSPDALTCVDNGGSLVWKIDQGLASLAFSADGRVAYVLSLERPILAGVDVATGKMIWKQTLKQSYVKIRSEVVNRIQAGETVSVNFIALTSSDRNVHLDEVRSDGISIGNSPSPKK